MTTGFVVTMIIWGVGSNFMGLNLRRTPITLIVTTGIVGFIAQSIFN